MSDTTTETPAVTETTGAPETPASEQTPKVFDEAYVKSLRDEAAAARVAKKDAVDAAVRELNVKHQAELAARDTAYTELQNDLGKAWIELEKLQTSLALKVPSERVQAFASFLQGEDKESIEASAKAAYDLAGGFKSNSNAFFDPTQGRGGSKDPLPLNGDKLMGALVAAVTKGAGSR
ncbi:scaffolding protein [Mycobacterium phage DarthPhader]|uniref:Scaffolding protein n=1 Tax=Mycobacterium phage DarthPhader TaxID=1912975 RepID=A0A1I9S3W2_9CAUD|nr:head scaffolding protein [Mycobacterium phage DarthPhader]AOZ61256.1 scaffolding protein [Mycobacterium phage DarthPhader]